MFVSGTSESLTFGVQLEMQLAKSPDNSVLSNAAISLLSYFILLIGEQNVTKYYGLFLLNLLLSSTEVVIGINECMENYSKCESTAACDSLGLEMTSWYFLPTHPETKSEFVFK